jgi:hypothetical protein
MAPPRVDNCGPVHSDSMAIAPNRSETLSQMNKPIFVSVSIIIQGQMN